jgi:transposase InsO family protein
VRPEELPAFAQAIDGATNIYVRAAIWLYLLTDVRKAELLQARWIDFYNHQRPHSAHGGRTPVLVYRDGLSPSGPGLRPDLRSTDLAA